MSRSWISFFAEFFAAVALPTQSGCAEVKPKAMIAVSAMVSGDDEGVGFRAMVMKQAIAYNLAGVAKNEPHNVVKFTLQGHGKRIEEALETIRQGTRKSSSIAVATVSAAVDPTLATFTVLDWTSASRQIATPYTLVFRLRSSDETVSKSEAKDIWHDILKTTLKGDDLRKLAQDD